MNEETVVAVYDTVAHAELAIGDLLEAGVPESAISRHAQDVSTGVTGAAKEPGFWARLFGGEPDHDTSVYERSVQGGATVVTVRIGEPHIDTVLDILDSHHPVDLDERAASYGSAGPGSSASYADVNYTDPDYTDAAFNGASPYPTTVPPTAVPPTAGVLTGGTPDDATLKLSEERLMVGKRLVNRGGTRIRRFVVETPVEERVSLHEERVTLERRPMSGDTAVTDADFSEKTIEMTETAEEAVVSKQAFVTEEVRLRKEATERVETIRDTVRKEDVEIEQLPGSSTSASIAKP